MGDLTFQEKLGRGGGRSVAKEIHTSIFKGQYFKSESNAERKMAHNI
jgi:hypothetical protein